jgi:hypothetical protein
MAQAKGDLPVLNRWPGFRLTVALLSDDDTGEDWLVVQQRTSPHSPWRVQRMEKVDWGLGERPAQELLTSVLRWAHRHLAAEVGRRAEPMLPFDHDMPDSVAQVRTEPLNPEPF